MHNDTRIESHSKNVHVARAHSIETISNENEGFSRRLIAASGVSMIFLLLCKQIEWFRFLMGDFLHPNKSELKWMCVLFSMHSCWFFVICCVFSFLWAADALSLSFTLRVLISRSLWCTLSFFYQTINLIKTMPEGRAGTYTWSINPVNTK